MIYTCTNVSSVTIIYFLCFSIFSKNCAFRKILYITTVKLNPNVPQQHDIRLDNIRHPVIYCWKSNLTNHMLLLIGRHLLVEKQYTLKGGTGKKYTRIGTAVLKLPFVTYLSIVIP